MMLCVSVDCMISIFNAMWQHLSMMYSSFCCYRCTRFW